MRLFILLTLFGCLQATASSYGQTVSLDLRNESLEKALKEIKRQTGYSFIYTRAQLKYALPVTIQLKDGTVNEALDYCFQNQPLSYTIEDKYVVVLDKSGKKETKPDQTIDISGKVADENGNALLRITVTAVKSKKSTFTNEKGEFTLKGVLENDILEFTAVGYGKVEIAIGKKAFHNITMKLVVGLLDETVIMAYGKTTKRLNTGSIGKVDSKEITQQPVSDPLATLHGKVPGLVVTQSSGVPGGSLKIQVRGQSSLRQGSEPLIIVDGVPLAANNQAINNQFSILTTSNGTSGLSPIANINPLDIESIEILKDADATAIYGSRGANGVVLITTKKGTVGKMRVFANFYTGWSKVPELPEMLNTAEYIKMRKEAIANDGFDPSTNRFDPGYAPDLLIWDTARDSNFSKMMLGNTSHTYNGHIGLSSGSENIQLFLSAGYNKEGTVFPGNMGINKISFTNNISYTAGDKKFSARLASSYSSAKNNLFNTSISSFLSIPPNAPPLYTPDGKLNWEEGGYYFNNPLAYLKRTYDAVSDNLLSNLQVEYRLSKGITIRSSFGYNSMQVSEKSIVPISARRPTNNPTGSLSISNNVYKSWIIEPQAEYETQLGKGRLDILIGSTFLQNKQNALSVDAEGYKSDNLINSLGSATSTNTLNVFSDYKYAAIFGRINYNWDQKYLLNMTGRRDGSSRFGSRKRFANFGAIGVGWLFQEEKFMQKLFPFISYGKVRTSYGLTGNDQIGDYRYLDTWTVDYYNYQGTSVLYPTALFNPLYGWETNRKFEAALELGFFKDRIYFSSIYFNNRSGNQLVDYTLAFQTGFSSIISNFPALVENKGYEFQFTATPIKSKKFNWSISANISIPSNKLVRFDGLSSSGYSSSYVEGKSLNLIYKLNSLGTNPATGVFDFEDIDKNNTISISKDLTISGKTDPRYYGGIRNTFTIKRIELNFFVDFKKQTGLNYLYSIYSNFSVPGFPINQPKYVLDRWQQPGDVTAIQKFTTITYNEAYEAKELLRLSNGVYSDASFMRLKTVSLAWQLPANIFKVIKTYDSKIFVSAQNFFTISSYKGTDPETQDYYALPTLRTIAVGINLNL
ncbi:SusC/RagA family TonB-linked outer membrane protein [Agriterribacter sp.]|uniref:SusC/RagA family TonB-linked outer membrane protein n=1 Tax=Agriterribacter sp. TaxID=2821509 RepID=UPI002CF30086|nr:SusC/RagA family TonB-linked outer membrane protein [Agriterribacter sp.]HTN05694.1 SusC/RagA family TonB-linked outer membrane protein [Agriterribacter sp.]